MSFASTIRAWLDRATSTVLVRTPRPRVLRLPVKGLLCSILFTALTVQALDPKVPIHQYARDSWNQQQGLTGTAIYGIHQLSDDYLWLNTSGGLMRFDGVRFVEIPLSLAGKRVEEGLLDTSLTSKGGLVLRSRTHTLLLNAGRFSECRPAAVLPKGKPRHVHQSPNGDVWLGCDNQIYKILPDRLELLIEHVSWVNAIVDDRQGYTWFATNNGLYAFKDGKVRYFPAKGYTNTPDFHLPHETFSSSISEGPGSCNVLLPHEDGLLVGSVTGLWKFKEGHFSQEAQTAGCGEASIYSLLFDRNGSLWVGTEGHGLFRHAQNRWSRFSSVDGLEDDDVLSMAEDNEGSLWIGTRGGLVRFRDSRFRTLTRADGLAADNVWSVVETRDGALYISSANAGITRLKDGVARHFTAKDGLARDAGGALMEDKDSRIWATTDQGLSCIEGDRVRTFTAGGFLPGAYIPALAEDAEGLILSRGDRRLYRFKDDQISPFNVTMAETSGPRSVRYVWNMHTDKEGNLWMAMSGGLYRLAAGRPPEETKPTAFTSLANSISEDDFGYLWIASTEVPGFSRLSKKDGSLVHYGPQAGVRADAIARILADQNGNLWMNTRDGIVQFDRQELDSFAEGKARSVTTRLFGTLDGLRTPECGLVGPQPAAWRGNDGRLYFCSRKGLVVLDPLRDTRNTRIPKVVIEETIIDGQAAQGEGIVVVPAGSERLEIHYTALSLRVPSRVRFRYLLEGYDSDWSEGEPRRMTSYTRLPPGTYQFHVIASNDDGVWNQEGARLTLVIRPLFYQTTWFSLLMAGCGLGLIYGLYKLRLRGLLQREQILARRVEESTADLRDEIEERMRAEKALLHAREHLERIVGERTAELQETNQRLQQEIREHLHSEEKLRQAQKLESIGRLAGGVAHDFNNLLTVINGYCDFWLQNPEESEESRSYAKEIREAGQKAAALTHQLLAFSRKQVMQFEYIDLNRLVADMERMLRRLLPEDLQLETHLENQACIIHADAGQINQVILNLVVNARDAISGSGRIRIETCLFETDAAFERTHPDLSPGSYVELSVSDTGHGMSKEVQSHLFEPFFTTKELGKGTGLGLSTVFGIVKQSGGHLWVESEEGKGTRFHILLPRIQGQAALPSQKKISATPKGNGECILVVEDQMEVRALAVRMLERQGYRILEASHGNEALEVSRQHKGKIDLLFTDLVMPGMGGRELGVHILEQRPDIKITYTSGYTDDSVMQLGAQDNGYTLLRKPYSMEQLIEHIDRALHQPQGNR